MKIKTSRRFPLSLESVAMTDIVMNLFIFFFISFSLLYTFNPHKESKIEVKLPGGAAREAAPQEEPLTITVTHGNEIYIGASRILPEALKGEVTSRSKSQKLTGVIVRADKQAFVETLVQVLDTAKQAGIQKLGVAILQD